MGNYTEKEISPSIKALKSFVTMGGIRKRRPKNPNKKDRETYPKGGYKDIVRENALFEAFYKSQEGLCPPEEFEKMMNALKSDLPASFRVTGFRSQAFAVRDLIEGTYFTALAQALKNVPNEAVENGEEKVKLLDPPKALPWYPDRLAWQLSITRKDIRREETLYKLHNFLISETESGKSSSLLKETFSNTSFLKTLRALISHMIWTRISFFSNVQFFPIVRHYVSSDFVGPQIMYKKCH